MLVIVIVTVLMHVLLVSIGVLFTGTINYSNESFIGWHQISTEMMFFYSGLKFTLLR